MINVNFTSDSGETMYSYSWKNCGRGKNVEFYLDDSSCTWCTVTPTPANSKVKINVESSDQTTSRNVNVKLKVNGSATPCSEYFHVEQSGHTCVPSTTYEITPGTTPSVPKSINCDATSFIISFYYKKTTINENCEETVRQKVYETITVECGEITGHEPRTISGNATFHEITIPYSVVQYPCNVVLRGHFNVTDKTNPTKILDDNSAYMINIDGAGEISPVTSYTFNTLGYHYVDYTLHNGSCVGIRMFEGCTNLSGASIPSSVTEISYDSFKESGIRSIGPIGSGASVEIPTGVTEFEPYSFASCPSLSSITIPTTITRIGDTVFYNDDALSSITIPNSVTYIGRRAFDSCSNLTNAILPESIDKISDSMFRGTKIKSVGSIGSGASVEIPSSITEIGADAFGSCYSLSSVTLPDNVKIINSEAFVNDNKLYSLNLGKVEIIGDGAFKNAAVTAVTLPTTLKTINDEAFDECRISALTIPSSVTFIGTNTFGGTPLTSITVDSSNSVYNSNGNCNAIIETSSKKLIQGCKTTTIPNTVIMIGDAAFHSINMTTVTIPNSVTSIGASAFSECIYMTSITIGNGITNINSYAFNGCNALTSFTIRATTPPTLSNTNVFGDTNNCPIYVPSGSVNLYKAASNWSTYASRIQAIP